MLAAVAVLVVYLLEMDLALVAVETAALIQG
jgi:hypothetical protein